jgi:hypothetical protein
MADYKQLYQCPISLTKNSITYLDFGMMPLVNNLADSKLESLECPLFPLAVNYYPESGLSMLSVAVDPKTLFSHYVYKSGTSQPYVEHCKEMFQYLSKFVSLKENDTCVDIGGNDGTLLKTFRDSTTTKLDLINVDPSENIGKISEKAGIPTVTKMFDHSVGCSPALAKKCKIITSTNVFQHTENISGFVSGIYHALRTDGVWCLEFPYWKRDLETYQYDQVYHEHIYYYLLTPLCKLFADRGLEIIDVSEQKIHGGSLRIISRIGRSKSPNPATTKFLKDESVFTDNFYKEWGNSVKTHLTGSQEYLTNLKASGKKIAGFGAAAKGCTFLNAAKINHTTIDYIVDDTDTKQNKFVPGTGIEIVSRETLIKDPPDYIVILAHNFADYIMNSLKPIYKGKFIKMFPSITVYD